MSADALLGRLDGVRQTGRDRWIAKCPGHDDKRPSLSIRELDDGRVLVHDFAGCSIEEILGAVGLDFDALYPTGPTDHHVRRERHPFNVHDVLKALPLELGVISVYVADVRAGRIPSHRDHERFILACGRIVQAVGIANAT